jgi:hypothetical protein
MIKLRCHNGVYVFGLTDANLELLRKGQPSMGDLGAIGGPADARVILTWGPDQAAIFREIGR